MVVLGHMRPWVWSLVPAWAWEGCDRIQNNVHKLTNTSQIQPLFKVPNLKYPLRG